MPSYTVTWDDGSTTDVPSGEDQLYDADTETEWSVMCDSILDQWSKDAKSKGYQAH